MADVSFLIPSRNEMFLRQTIENVLANCRGDSEIIAILDGAWADPPVADHPRVRLVYLPEAIGQRAATNLAARLANGRYVCKLDAHCAIDEGFDVKMFQAGEELGHDVTQIPAMYNLRAFMWRCQACGDETYQGPHPTTCEPCGKKGAAGGPFERVIYWDLQAGGVPGKPIRTEFWRFDHEMHFQYDNKRKRHQDAKGEIVDVMSSIGACFFMRRERFFELGGLDEAAGSWGSFGVEVACKSWLSGGRHVTNKRTWFSHLFRTKGGSGWGFPYENPGRAVDHARRYTTEMWMQNKWPLQVRPLSWLIEKFAPLDGWHGPEGKSALDRVTAAGAVFSSVCKGPVVLGVVGGAAHNGSTDCASSERPLRANAIRSGGEQVALVAVGLATVDSCRGGAAEEVCSQRDECEMGRVTAASVVADDVIELWNIPTAAHRDRLDQPRIHEPVDEHRLMVCPPEMPHEPITGLERSAGPDPAASRAVDNDLGKDSVYVVGRESANGEILGISHDAASYAVLGLGADGVQPSSALPILSKDPTKGLIYYSDVRGDARILQAVRQQIQLAAPDLPIVSVTLQPVDFGQNIVLPLERCALTMFRQILAGLEALETDVAFLVEHDCLYHPSHFLFTPPRRDRFYYNEHRYQVCAETGRAVHYRCCQTAELCADRDLLIDHYRKRIAAVEAVGGYQRHMGYEPGTNRWSRSIDPHEHETWRSAVPNLDIRHGRNLSKTRWSPAEFRNKSTCQGWIEVDEIPGWGVTQGRFQEFLADVLQHQPQVEGAA